MVYQIKHVKNSNYKYHKSNFLFKQHKKYFHTLSINKSILYLDSLYNKSKILKENKDRSGIYRWIYSISNKSYVGSSRNITKRLKKYYNINYLSNKIIIDNSLIYKALLKHGYSKFNFEILEYCHKNSLLNREQYYLDILKPEYNICKIAGSMKGFKHSAKTLLKFKNRKTVGSFRTIVINKENKTKKTYNSLRAAAKSIGVSHTTLRRYSNNNKLLKGLFFIKSNSI